MRANLTSLDSLVAPHDIIKTNKFKQFALFSTLNSINIGLLTQIIFSIDMKVVIFNIS